MPTRALHLATCTVDLDRGEVHRQGEVAALTALELALLRYLAERPDQVVPREELLREVWGYRAGAQTRAVDIAMRRLREKLGEPGRGGHLRTMHGAGYRYSPPTALVLKAPGLPLPADPLIGRAEDLDAIGRALRTERALILHGPPGIGKTRLALAFGASRHDEFAGRGGVWWVPLQRAEDLDGLLAAVAAHLEVPLPASGAVARLGQALAARGPLLLLLDNLDAVAGVAGEALSGWLSAAPGLHLLGTSQRPVPGLPLLGVGPLLPEHASALFLSGARALRPDFPETGVAELVAALDHHPLSLALVAGQARLFDAPALRARLGEAPLGERVDATVARSLALLAPQDADALDALSVFRGGFPPEAADAVLGERAPERLERLIQAALLIHTPPRLRVHEAVRRVCAARLRERPREAAVREAHAAWLCATVAPRAERLARSPDPAGRQALRQEEDNLRAALHPSVPLHLRAPITRALVDLAEVHGQEPRALAVLDGLGPLDALDPAERRALLSRRALLLARVGDVHQGLMSVEALDALDEPEARAWAAYARAQIKGKQGALAEAVAAAADACDRAVEAGDQRLYGMALAERAVMATSAGDLEGGVGLYQRAREVLEATGEVRTLGRVLCNLGLLFGLLGRQEAETTLLRQASALLAERGLPRDLANCELVLATSLLEQGQHDAATEHLEQARRRVAAMGDPFSHLRTRLIAGEIARDAGRFSEAETELLAGLAEAERMDHQHYRAALLRGLGELYDAHRQPERAVGLYGRALAAARGGRNPFCEAQILGALGALAADGDRLDLAARVLEALPEDLDERELRLCHLDLARARLGPSEEAATHRAQAASRILRARRGGPGQRFTVASSERLRSALRVLDLRLRSDGGLKQALEPWVLRQVEALLG